MCAIAIPAHAGKPDDKSAVLASVSGLIDGWRDADSAKAAAVLDPEFRLVTLRETDDGPNIETETRDHLLQTMAQLKPGMWDDRLGKPIVHVDKTGIATVWAPYTFYLRGKLSHCGIETFQLYRKSEKWSIVNFADTHLWVADGVKCPAR